ncbi:MAG: VOC family protein [Bacteroidota bacterium]
MEAYWGVDDISTEYARLLHLGATEHNAPQEVGGDIWVATLKDPWGNLIGLIKNPHFKAV